MEQTLNQYDKQFEKCKELFKKKTIDYGTAWRILRPASLTDQIFIKANRIRTIQETGETKVDEGIEPEFIGIVNYCIMALIQLEIEDTAALELPADQTIELYQQYAKNVRDLMIAKNHDYGEAWRDMRIPSLTDLILMKILRTKQIEDNKGQTLVSEGIDANYYDMINYALFALILMEEEK
ncbi:MAG: DUF1599 domain-containing protein [Flavobacteriales bacterium]|jgi:hypothetical protein|nr:DUF1599 domain-containing protein [Flavobacteriales bacterium]